MKIKLLAPIILFIWSMALFESCNSHQHVMNRLSSDMYDIQVSVFGEDIFLKGLNACLQRSNWYKKLEFSTIHDTIFLLERPGIQGDYYFTFWNKMDTLSYSNETGSFEYDDEPKFIKYMMKLVSEWDISKIREEEKIHPNLLPGESVYATRIIIHNGKYKIGCFCFKDFFDFKRDNIDFIKKK